MSEAAMPLPAVEPTVVIVDSSPLIHLAMIGELDLTLKFGPVVVPDAVEIETTFDRTRPFADEIGAWLDANGWQPGRNRWIERPETEIGGLLRLAAETGRPRPRNVGEHAIVNWLADHILSRGGPALVVYENGKVPAMLIREGLPADVIVVTCRAFLQLGQQAGFLSDADAAWTRIAEIDRRANPVVNYQVVQGLRP